MAKFDIDDDVKVTMGMDISIGEYAPRGTVSITENGLHNVGGYKYADVDVEPEPQPLQSKTATPTESTQSIVPDENYYGLSEVTVNGISSTYVGTGIARNDSSNLTVIGSVVSGPSGYYSQAFSKAVDIGTIRQNGWSESVSGSNLNMYPNLVFSSGYISSSPSIERLFNVIEKTVTPSTSQIIVQRENANQWLSKITIEPIPSEYIVPSGTLNITSGGTQDVTNYAYVSVPSGTAGQPYVMTEFRTNHTAVMTPLVTNTAGYISGSTKMGNTLTVSASELASGTYNITSNGIYDVTNYASASVSVSGGSGDYTIDDIVMRSFPSIISGSASFINSYAFYNYTSLISANFQNATYISDFAFAACSYLSSISFPSVTYIGSYAFASCYNLTTVSLPSASSIYTYAFWDCSGLTSVDFPNVKYISTFAFYSCRNLNTISFPSAISIGAYAFSSCQSLISVNFPNVKYIGSNAFAGCGNLTTISFPVASSVVSHAFARCSSLEIADFPALKLIPGSMFASCYNLTTVSLPSASSTIGSGAFQYCSSLESIDIPNVTSAGAYVFSGCINLKTINLPKVSNINYSMFLNCSALTSAIFPSAGTVWNSGFYNCHNLSYVLLSKYGNLYSKAFGNCYNLLSLYLLSKDGTCGLDNINVFESTPIAGYTDSTSGVYGSVFVPSIWYSFYTVSSPTWATFSSRIVSLTDAEIETLLEQHGLI